MEKKATVKIPYGLRDGELVHISKIKEQDLHGRSCGCVCPNCKVPLEARISKDGKRQPYFAHTSCECSYQHAIESTIHLMAKKIISEKKKLLFPAITENIKDIPRLAEISDQYYGALSECGFSNILEIKPQRYVSLDSVEVERTIGDIKPDLVVHAGKRMCFIEIAVTHFIDEIKKDKIKKMDYPVLEIDLSDYKSKELKLETLERELIDNHENRKWIHYPKLDEAREYAINKRIREIDNSNNQSIKMRAKDNKAYYTEVERLRNDELAYQNIKQLNFYKKMIGLELPFFLDIPIRGEVYINCDRRIWQSIIFDKFIYYRNDGEVLFKNIQRWLENYNQSFGINWSFGTSAKTSAQWFYNTIKHYLRYLSFLGFISPIYDVAKKGYYCYDAALWNTRSLDVLDRFSNRADVLHKAIKMMSNENVNPDAFIERMIREELDIDIYDITTSKSPHDWCLD